MRTLKKALSLVLVLAMVFALAVPGFAADTTKKASDFKDYSKVTNKEAVTVLTAIGVVSGNTDGTFGPEGNFTRAQAASIIAHMMLGTGADALKKVATDFSDVPANHWASGYVAYCANEGIINGYGNGKFGPDDTLTAAQWALMLLGALGYKAANEGIGGAGFAVPTTALAIKAKIATAEDMNATFNRDVAVKLALNTLMSHTVSYSGGTNITTSDGTTIVTGAVRNTDATQLKDSQFASLNKADAPAGDDFGRPGTTWTYKNKNIGTFGKTADMVFTGAVAGINNTAKANAMGLKGYTIASGVKPATNGVPAGSAITSVDDIAALTGNGVKVEVFLSDTTANKVEAVVVTKTDLMKVAAITSTKITLTGVTNAVTSSLIVDKDNANFASLSAMKKGDYVLAVPVKVSSAYILSAIATPETVTGKITATTVVSGSTTGLTVNGTAYPVAAVAGSDVTGATANATVESTLWLDSYGNVIYVENATAAATKNFLFVLSTYQTLTDGKIVSMAKGVLTNGEIVDVPYTGTAADCTLYAVSSVTNGVYTLTAATAGTSVNTYVALKNNGTIKASDRALNTNSAATATNYFSSKVVFVYVDTTNKTVVVKNGVQSVNPIVAANSTDAVAVLEKNSATDNTPVVTMVILKSNVSTTATSDNLLYVADNTAVGSVTVDNKATGKQEVINTYVGYKNGEKVTFASKNAPASAKTFYTYAETEATGAYVLSAAYTATTGATAVKADEAVSSVFDNRIATIDSVAMDISGAQIVDLRSAADQASAPIVATAEGIADATTAYASLNVSVVYDANTGIASLVYIVANGAART